MPYTIKHYDKSNTNPGVIVNTKKVDNSTALSFYGLNSSEFGSGLNENYLHLMENFCNKDIAIAKLVPGQLWFDSVLKKMKIWTGSKWHILKEYTTNVTPKGFVTVVGNIVNGSTVSTANTLYDEDGLGDFSYQWYLDSQPILNATEATYTIVLSDVGHSLAVSLSYIDGSNNKETVYSKQYPINPAANNLATGTLIIDGLAIIGETVTAIVNNIDDADGWIGGNFGWLLDNVDMTGENNPTYVIKPSDAGKTLKAKYYFTDLFNNNEVVYSSGVVVALAVTTTTVPATTTTSAPIITTTTTTTEAAPPGGYYFGDYGGMHLFVSPNSYERTLMPSQANAACAALSNETYTWYWPSYAELELLYNAKSQLTKCNFRLDPYCSSDLDVEESSPSWPYYKTLNFQGGSDWHVWKSGTTYLRPIRKSNSMDTT